MRISGAAVICSISHKLLPPLQVSMQGVASGKLNIGSCVNRTELVQSGSMFFSVDDNLQA